MSKKRIIGVIAAVIAIVGLYLLPAQSAINMAAVTVPTCTKPTGNPTHQQQVDYAACLQSRTEALLNNYHQPPPPAPTVTQTVTVTATPTPTPTPTPTATPTAGTLDLPRVPWEGGSAYYKKFAKADAAGWDDPTFFPISVFLSPPSQATTLKNLGINTYMSMEHSPPLATATNAGMFVLAQQSEWTQAEVGTNPNVVGWFLSDECEMGYSGCPEGEAAGYAQQKAYSDKVRAYNDGRFTQANFGNGVLRSFWAPNYMDDHVKLLDVSSVDKYAYTSPDVRFELNRSPDWPSGANPQTSAAYGWMTDQMRSFQDPQDRHPVWTFVETKRPYVTEAGATSITPDQIEGAVWSSIIHEARGIAYFQHNNDPSCGNYSLNDCGTTLQNRITSLNAKIKSLAPVLNTQSYQYDFANGTDTMLKVLSGDAYIFAGIGLNETAGSKTFTLPNGVTGTTVTVVGENRTLPVTNGKFTDSFAAEYTHHVYKVTL